MKVTLILVYIILPRSIMSVKITRLKGMKFKAESDGLEIISGRLDKNSDLEGMMPGRLMAASLGLCTGMHVASYLKRHKLEADGLSLTVEVISGRDPSRAVEFDVELKLNLLLDEKQKKAIIAEAGRCYVSNTLKNTPKINITFNTSKHMP